MDNSFKLHDKTIAELKKCEYLFARYICNILGTTRISSNAGTPHQILAKQQKMWSIIGQLEPPYQDKDRYQKYMESLKLFKLGLNITTVQDYYVGSTLNISQLIIICEHSNEWSHLSNKNKRNMLLELCSTIKNDTNDLNKIYGIKLLIKQLSLLTDAEQQLIQRAFRFKKDIIYKDPERLMEQIVKKYIPQIAEVWKITQLFKTKNIIEVDILEWAELFQTKKLIIKTVQPPEDLIDFTF